MSTAEAACACARLHSFAHQSRAVLEQQPTRVLGVGVGPGLITASLRQIASM